MSIPSNPFPADTSKQPDAANVEKQKDHKISPIETPEDEEINSLAKKVIANDDLVDDVHEPLDATRVKPEPVDDADVVLDVGKEILFPESDTPEEPTDEENELSPEDEGDEDDVLRGKGI